MSPIERTRKWIQDVVIGCNFCPFAAAAFNHDTIHYQVEPSSDAETCLQALLAECVRLDTDTAIETSLLILPNACSAFEDYLDLVAEAEAMLKRKHYEGTYQVASFHPLYRFADSPIDDAANYTNRSIYPMLHLLRESSVELALSRYPDPEQIPERNIDYARHRGLAYMQALRDKA